MTGTLHKSPCTFIIIPDLILRLTSQNNCLNHGTASKEMIIHGQIYILYITLHKQTLQGDYRRL